MRATAAGIKFNIQRYKYPPEQSKITINNNDAEHISKILSLSPCSAIRPPSSSVKFLRLRGWQSLPSLLM